MTSVADKVAELAVMKHEVDTDATRVYESIKEWTRSQRSLKVRLLRWLRPWKAPVLHPSIPFRPLWWRVIVMIKPPETISKGGIIKARITTDAEQFLTYVGMVVWAGSLAYKAETRAGLKMSREWNPKPGDTVVFFKNAGTRFATIDGLQFVQLADSEIWGPTETPEKLDTMSL